jgi:hypothetical protein
MNAAEIFEKAKPISSSPTESTSSVQFFPGKKTDRVEGMTVAGKLAGKEASTDYLGKPCENYILTADDKKIVLGNLAVINRTLAEVTVGETVAIRYKGEVQSKNGFTYPDFEIRVLPKE